MMQLLKVELYKTTRHLGLMIFLGLCALLFGVMTVGDLIWPSLAPLYKPPYIWHTIAAISGGIEYNLAFALMMNVFREFTDRTVKQSIASGMSRWKFVYAKALMNGLIALVCMLMVFIAALALRGGWGIGALTLSTLEHGLGVFALLSFALFLAMWLKQQSRFLIAGPLLMVSSIVKFTQFNLIISSLLSGDRLDPSVVMWFAQTGAPSVLTWLATIAWIMLWIMLTIMFTAGSYAVFKKADL